MTKVNVLRLVRRRIPITRWLPAYTTHDVVSDLVAGLTIGLTLIPQAIAYAALAGLGPQYGLYSAFAGSLVYIFLGTCPEINIGPTALLSLLTFTYARGVPEYAILLCFLSGCVTMTLGILRLGFLVEFVSTPVVSGFTSAASVIIACSQIKGIIGVSIKSEGFVETWEELYNNINNSRMADLILSCCCIIFLLTLKRIKETETTNKLMKRTLWFLGTGRNAILVIACAIMSYVFVCRTGETPYLLTGHIDSGLPSFNLPPFSITTGNDTVGFLEMCKTLGTGIIIVPLISVIGNVAIAKAFSHGKTLDATQEILTLGVCNAVGSFFHSMPVTGSFSRSAVSNASGVKTPMAGLYTGSIVILALSLLTPYFYYIPKATLSSVIICAVIFMIEVGMVQPIWKCSKKDLIPALTTFFACLFAGVELGIIIGVAIDLAILLYFNSRPIMYIEYRSTPAPGYILVRPSAGLLFPSVNYVRKHLTEAIAEKHQKSVNNPRAMTNVVLDCKHIDRIDFTAVQGLNAVIKDLKSRDCNFVMLQARQEILQCVQSFSNDPILTAHSEVELITILKHLVMKNRTLTETRLKILNLPNVKNRSNEEETVSTNL
ncbi:sodium-independent sulfate anion transporter isoform X2 [Cephus cinctus]|nr:sodium-independent sulfate anion transporter isoform X2 [Cephus cinctus]